MNDHPRGSHSLLVSALLLFAAVVLLDKTVRLLVRLLPDLVLLGGIVAGGYALYVLVTRRGRW